MKLTKKLKYAVVLPLALAGIVGCYSLLPRHALAGEDSGSWKKFGEIAKQNTAPLEECGNLDGGSNQVFLGSDRKSYPSFRGEPVTGCSKCEEFFVFRTESPSIITGNIELKIYVANHRGEYVDQSGGGMKYSTGQYVSLRAWKSNLLTKAHETFRKNCLK